jgi:hypothetical protein
MCMVYFVSETAQVELERGQLEAPGGGRWRAAHRIRRCHHVLSGAAAAAGAATARRGGRRRGGVWRRGSADAGRGVIIAADAGAAAARARGWGTQAARQCHYQPRRDHNRESCKKRSVETHCPRVATCAAHRTTDRRRVAYHRRHQGFTLVQLSAPRKRLYWDKGY